MSERLTGAFRLAEEEAEARRRDEAERRRRENEDRDREAQRRHRERLEREAQVSQRRQAEIRQRSLEMLRTRTRTAPFKPYMPRTWPQLNAAQEVKKRAFHKKLRSQRTMRKRALDEHRSCFVALCNRRIADILREAWLLHRTASA